MIAKIILAITMAASAFLGGSGFDQEQSAEFDGYYLFVDESGQPSLWAETNGHDGLQTRTSVAHAGPIRFEFPPDNRVLL